MWHVVQTGKLIHPTRVEEKERREARDHMLYAILFKKIYETEKEQHRTRNGKDEEWETPQKIKKIRIGKPGKGQYTLKQMWKQRGKKKHRKERNGRTKQTVTTIVKRRKRST